jgi:glycosyltransferase involved in cell wall biosynthesis
VSEDAAIDVSFVVPLHNTGEALYLLLDAFRTLKLTETWELVLVDDGSMDGTFAAAKRVLSYFPVPVILVELARNFGEHAAVLEAYRRSRGRFVVNLDDDLQNPLAEALKLLAHLRDSDAEVDLLVLCGEKTLLVAQPVQPPGQPVRHLSAGQAARPLPFQLPGAAA